jgi:hypothetical protein
VVPVNPEVIARRRGPARKKDDAEDARIAGHLALDRFAPLNPLIPHGETAGELRAIARDDARANRDERRLLNRLRAELIAVFPAALAVAGDAMGRRPSCGCRSAGPPPRPFASAAGAELVAFARANHSRFAERFADRVQAACAHDHFVAPDHLVRAKATASGSPPRSRCSSAGSAGRGSGAWANCYWVDLGAARPTSPPTTSRGRDSLVARSTAAFRAWVTVSPPGSPVSSATTSSSSRRRTRCHAMRARRR